MLFSNCRDKNKALLKENQLQNSVLDALNKSFAVIEFTPDGIVKTANDNFLKTMGYQLDEVIGQHHRIFVSEVKQATSDYQSFWSDLAAGKFFKSRFCRVDKKGNAIWLEATYNPVFDENGAVVKVVKYATDITKAVEKDVESSAKLDAISQVMAVIEFDTLGNILTANPVFCKTMGYELS